MSKQSQPGVGVDIVEVSRFLPCKKKDHPFLKKVFTRAEIKYCFSFSNTPEHLAGHFAIKEAVSKALGVEKYPFAEIEVRHLRSGAPVIYHNGKKLKVSVSVSHTKDVAIAVALFL